MASSHAFLVAFVVALLCVGAEAQLLKTVNGSVVMQIAGASLTLSSTSSTAEASLLNTIDATINAEQARALAAESSIAGQVASERTRALQAEAGETMRAMNAEAGLAANLSSEQIRAMNVEGSLGASINAEVVRARAAESAETTRALLAEGNITAQVNTDRTRAMMVEFNLAANLSSETIRALQAEGAISTLLTSEVSRASAVERSLAQGTTAEQTRATVAEASLTQALSATQASLSTTQTMLGTTQTSLGQTQTSLSQAQATLVQTQASLVASLSTQVVLASSVAQAQSTLAAYQASTNSTLAILVQQLTTINSCAAQGRLAAPNGTCILGTASATTSSTSTCAASNTTAPLCAPGFSPVSSATSVCSGTTFTCTAVPCPANSTGINVPAGCACNAGFSGTITASLTTPYFAGSCVVVPCPGNTTGTNVPAGCSCAAGFVGTVTASTVSPFIVNTCVGVPCPAGTTGQSLGVGCSCPAGYSNTVVANTNPPNYFTGSCVAMSCAALKAQTPGITSGVYALRIPAVNGGSPFSIYCDFVIDGGIGYGIVFNRYFAGYQQGPSAAEMAVTTPVGTVSMTANYAVCPGTIFSNYGGSGATRMIVYATTGQTNVGGIAGTTYRAVRFTMNGAQMVNCWNGNANAGFNTNIPWAAFPTGLTGSQGTMLNGHGTSGGVYQWSETAAAVNSGALFEYSPAGGADTNHYWSVFDSTSSPVGTTYYRTSTLYGADSANNGPLFNRNGGIALF